MNTHKSIYAHIHGGTLGHYRVLNAANQMSSEILIDSVKSAQMIARPAIKLNQIVFHVTSFTFWNGTWKKGREFVINVMKIAKHAR